MYPRPWGAIQSELWLSFLAANPKTFPLYFFMQLPKHLLQPLHKIEWIYHAGIICQIWGLRCQPVLQKKIDILDDRFGSELFFCLWISLRLFGGIWSLSMYMFVGIWSLYMYIYVHIWSSAKCKLWWREIKVISNTDPHSATKSEFIATKI